ncbi:MAG: hypothetical protein B7Z44_19250 [Caulobacter sp. 12-67-6]|nr:MAG: hypothetical protein B7Z44_19250 [Caulobacter sp. 12-67-6]
MSINRNIPHPLKVAEPRGNDTMKRLFVTSASVALTLGLAAPAFAQTQAQPPAAEDQDPGRDVVVVSAQKRDEDIQDVPISISAFSEETLDEAGISDIRDLRNIAPSLNLATAPQLANTRIEIRGIGTSGNTAIEPSVALFLDGAYVPRSAALVSGLNDIRSVEVLRGPQGTLFGRNASMGAMLVNTNEAKAMAITVSPEKTSASQTRSLAASRPPGISAMISAGSCAAIISTQRAMAFRSPRSSPKASRRPSPPTGARVSIRMARARWSARRRSWTRPTRTT